jgi:glycosyltransferase involved in cell wall biosynthesis
MEQLKLNGWKVYEYYFTDNNIYVKLPEVDCVIMHRVPYIPYIDQIIRKAKKFGVKVYFDIDDIVFDMEYAKKSDGINYLSEEEKKLYFEGVKRYRKTLERCDGVITSTKFLHDVAKKYNTNVGINRNCISRELFELSEKENMNYLKKDSIIRIGYFSGTKTHNKDFLEAADALYEILKKYKNVHLVIGGLLDLPKKFDKVKQQIEKKPLVPWKKLPSIIKQVDINLAPLEPNNPFCRAKSELKYFEAAILKIPTVASNIDAFRYAIDQGRNGFLAQNINEWYENLEKLILDEELRKEVGINAYEDALENYTSEKRGKNLINVIDKLDSNRNKLQVEVKGLIINFLIPQPFKGSGGHTTIFRMMRYLTSVGHTVNAYVQPGNNFKMQSNSDAQKFADENFFITGAKFYIDKGKFVNSDIFIATSWPTAYIVNNVTNTKEKFYFIQDFEPYFYPMSSEYKLAENSYRLPLKGITIGQWLTNKLSKDYDLDCDYINFGVDSNLYNFDGKKVSNSEKIKIVFYARASTPRRGFEIAVKALKLVYEKYKDKIDIILFGGKNLDKDKLNFKYIDKGVLTQKELAKLYKDSHIGLVLSLTNCSLLPLELMASKCAVVDISSETVEGIMQHEVNAILAKPYPESIADCIGYLIENKTKREEIVDRAYKYALSFTWEKAGEQFDNILISKTVCNMSGSLIRSIKGNSQENIQYPLPELNYGTKVSQVIKASYNNLHRIDVFIGNYGRNNDIVLKANIRSYPNGKVIITSGQKNMKNVKDNSWVNFEFDPIVNSQGRYYIIDFEMNCNLGEGVSLYAAKNDIGFELQINNLRQEGTLAYRSYYKNSETLINGVEDYERIESETNVDNVNEIATTQTLETSEMIDLLQKKIYDNLNAKSTQLDTVWIEIKELRQRIQHLELQIDLAKHSLPYRVYSKIKRTKFVKLIKKMIGR